MRFNFKEILIKNREIAQLIYGIVLIILIPLLIVYNTVFIIKKYNAILDVTLQRQALAIGRTVKTLIENDLNSATSLQEKINHLMVSRIELSELSILLPEGDNFRIVASNNPDSINQVLNFYYYHMAWIQPEGDALATDSTKLAKTKEGRELISNTNAEERYWLVAMPLSDGKGVKQALLTMKISSKIIDDLTNYNRNASIYLLVGTVIVVILFLLVAVRLWDYALLYRKIKEVDQMKDDFISMASHELRAPVTGIRGYTSMILEGTFGAISDKVKESLSIIQSTAERLAILVDDLLNVSRIEQGRLEVNLKATSIGPLIAETIAEVKGQARAKGLQLIFAPHKEKLPSLNIDPDRFKQVLVNLVGNAVKYTEKGLVDIITEEKNNGRLLEIKVKDTGIGMSAEEREKLFDKFYRVKNERTKNIAGTGLGLWITKQIVELMGGTIMIDSIENVGTQVTLYFPIVKS